jgi:hydroxymethylbilane synthase
LIAKLIIGTRASQLALLQTQQVVDALQTWTPGLEIQVKKISTSGDRDTTSALNLMGNTGVFVKELEKALVCGEIDIAVHSLKDMPTVQPPGLTVAAVLPREDPRDALVLGSRGCGIPTDGDRIGTGSLRRQVQLKKYYPTAITCPVRGNIGTRLNKLDKGEYDGLIMAAAALMRMGLAHRITTLLPLDRFIPAGGQGAIAIETRQDTALSALMNRLNHLPTWQAVTAERAFLNELGAGCHAPVGVIATLSGNTLEIKAMAAGPGDAMLIYDTARGDANQATETGIELARRMKTKGALTYYES